MFAKQPIDGQAAWSLLTPCHHAAHLCFSVARNQCQLCEDKVNIDSHPNVIRAVPVANPRLAHLVLPANPLP